MGVLRAYSEWSRADEDQHPKSASKSGVLQLRMPSADGWPRMPVLPVGPPEMKGIQLVAIGSDGSGSSGREGRHRDQQHELSDQRVVETGVGLARVMLAMCAVKEWRLRRKRVVR